MISHKTSISWTDATINPWVGCTAVSAGCDHCYAKTMVDRDRGHVFRHAFETVTMHLDRLAQLRKFGPIRASTTSVRPRMLFVNSMSDFFHEQVPDEAIHQALDAFEQYPKTVMQILTKRPARARKLLVDRYANSGIPANMWFGASVEDNRVAGRLNIMRRLKDQTGGTMTLFASVEPIVGPTDAIDFTGLDWVITGGESGPGARVMQREWLLPAIENAQQAGARLWHKQSGTMRSHPNLDQAPAGLGITAKFKWLVENGWEVLPDEKGGATVDKQTYRDLPISYDQLKAKLSDSLL
jgi:protein gp37